MAQNIDMLTTSGAYAAGEQYLPPEMADRKYYQPTNRGLETKIGEKLDYLAKLDANSQQKRYEKQAFLDTFVQ